MHFNTTPRSGRRGQILRVARTAVLACTAAAMAVSAPGCQPARVTHSVPPKLFDNDADAQLDFWHTLATEKLTSNDEAFHGLLLYVDGHDAAKTYDERVKLLKSRKMLPADFKGAANEAVTRGTLSVPIVRVLQLKGGLMMHIVGPTPRYALRELEYAGVFPTSSPNQVFSGTEFVGVIGKLDDYQNGIAAPVTGRLAEQ